MADSPRQPPFRRLGALRPASPIVLSVPHAGRAYSETLLAAARLPRRKLELLEDRLVDRLVWRAVAAGAAAIIADAPRAEIDLNRDERELDPALVVPRPREAAWFQSARTRGGLGLVPDRIAGAGPIWRQRLSAGELARRVETIHRPYHEAVGAALRAARQPRGRQQPFRVSASGMRDGKNERGGRPKRTETAERRRAGRVGHLHLQGK